MAGVPEGKPLLARGLHTTQQRFAASQGQLVMGDLLQGERSKRHQHAGLE